MGGLSLRTLPLAVMLSAATIAGIGRAEAAKAPEGASKPLGISFKVDGGKGWCGANVQVTLTTKKAENFTRDREAFQRMLGRIRAIVEGECSQVRAIRYVGYADGDNILVGEAANLTRWVYVPLEVDDINEVCQGPRNPTLCKTRFRTFNFARSLFGKPGFEKVQFTRYLSTDDGADIEFISEGAKGRIISVDTRFTPVPYKNAMEFAESQIQSAETKCSGEVQQRTPMDIGDRVSYRGFSCTTGQTNESQNLVIVHDGNDFRVIGVASFNDGGKSSQAVATQIMQSLIGDQDFLASAQQQEGLDTPANINSASWKATAIDVCGQNTDFVSVNEGQSDPPISRMPDVGGDYSDFDWQEWQALTAAPEAITIECRMDGAKAPFKTYTLPTNFDLCIHREKTMFCGQSKDDMAVRE